MAKLTYWVAESIDDGSHGSIAGKTKKAVLTRIADCLEEFEPVVKRTVFYTDAFDLMIKVADLGILYCGYSDEQINEVKEEIRNK